MHILLKGADMVGRKKIKELLNESACEHSKNKKQGCNIVKPGLGAGGCAFEGAQISLFPFADAVHLVHGPQTCLGASWETRLTPSSYEKANFTYMGFTTGITTNDIIFGGDKRLDESIEYIMKKYSPEAIFVYQTCVTALIGDNIDSICKIKSKKFNIPIVPVHAPGFVGSKNLGSRLAGEDVLEHLIGTKEPEYTTPYDINIIGNYNVTGDLWQITPVLEKIGIRVLSTLSGDGRIEKIKTAHRAKLNVINCSKSLITLCRKMKEKYNIPWISASFYGKSETSASIINIAKALGDSKLVEKAVEVTKNEEAKIDKKLKPYIEKFRGKKAVLNTGGEKAWSIASALKDLGIKVIATSVAKSVESDIKKAKEILGEDIILMKSPTSEQIKIVEENGANILLGGGRSLYTAFKKGIPYINVNQEKKKIYGGYGGLLNLAKDLDNVLDNPVFKNYSKKAPWEVEL
jgi:nitrogenase molybdenum-cofactor synthesis protein NifE